MRPQGTYFYRGMDGWTGKTKSLRFSSKRRATISRYLLQTIRVTIIQFLLYLLYELYLTLFHLSGVQSVAELIFLWPTALCHALPPGLPANIKHQLYSESFNVSIPPSRGVNAKLQ